MSTDDWTVYSGFAVGYFDPETAGQDGGGADADGGTGGGLFSLTTSAPSASD